MISAIDCHFSIMSVYPILDLLERGLLLHRCGAVAEAAALYAEVLQADPANADAHRYLAMISCHAGRFADGAELACKALLTHPRDTRARTFCWAVP